MSVEDSKFTEVKDSGERQEFETGSVRDTEDGKGRPDLFPTYPLRRLAVHYQNGAKKYGDRNWEKGQPLGRYLGSAFRHWLDLMDNTQDEDHASAILWNIIAYMHTRKRIEDGLLPAALDDLGHTTKEPS